MPNDASHHGIHSNPAAGRAARRRVRGAATAKTLFPPYGIKEYSGVRVAFIGLTLRATGTMLSPQARAGIEFRDEAEAVRQYLPELRAKDVNAIVVLIHQDGFNRGGANECVERARTASR